jgi:hypothetical protein
MKEVAYDGGANNDSSSSSVGGYVNISDFITEEAPISAPKEKN